MSFSLPSFPPKVQIQKVTMAVGKMMPLLYFPEYAHSEVSARPFAITTVRSTHRHTKHAQSSGHERWPHIILNKTKKKRNGDGGKTSNIRPLIASATYSFISPKPGLHHLLGEGLKFFLHTLIM